MNPTYKQIGGNHYKTAIQPVEYIHANKLNFFEGNVIKYITRHRAKGGKSDLQKAIHYIEMLIQFEYSEEKKSEVDPFIVDGLAEFNEELQTLQVNIPKDTVLEEGIIIKDVTYPFNPKEYETETNPNCNGCMFYTNDGFCKVPNSELTRNCNLKSIIYKSLNPW